MPMIDDSPDEVLFGSHRSSYCCINHQKHNEALTCNVCDRSFSTRRQLSDHQQKKRHFGCSSCDSLFPSLMALEHHKEEFQHWSDSSCCSRSDSGDSDDGDHHDRHRLL